ncbi:flagellar protein FlaG [Candidatus Poribacteria bacterium]|jgi:uncharacterized FlaG/YvyC family protein|nr:flagellar protein FlaG [Candidatus Poribacteria bacterium]|tara:strand:- start:1041 stop:1418 length:378 start_codon:yes stop_codon:yes gene_type:complete
MRQSLDLKNSYDQFRRQRQPALSGKSAQAPDIESTDDSPSGNSEISATDPVSQMEALKAVLKKIEENSPLATEVYNFEIRQDTGKIYVRVEDKEGNLIRQIPPERFLEVNENISQMIGLFLDQRG